MAELPRIALLRIRRAAGAGDAELCLIEADHVHNLPQLLANYSPDLLTFYLNVERETYREQLQRHPSRDPHHRDVREMQSPWLTLERHVHVAPRLTQLERVTPAPAARGR